MPRGAISKRTESVNPGGAGGVPGLAFLDYAAMAAYDASALTNGAVATVLSTGDVWTYDPTSVLAPDVTATAPLGQTIVAATGPGNWLRSHPFVLRWAEQTTWVVDPIAGSVEGAGSALDPVDSLSEVLRRITALDLPPLALGGWDVLFLSDTQTADAIVIDARMTSGANPLVLRADPVVLFSGVISGAVNYNPGARTFAQITAAALPVSWTASGLVGKLAVVTAGPRLGTEFWIVEDIGAKSAIISQPQAAIFDATTSTVQNGDEFSVYELVQVGSVVSILATGGEGAQVDALNVELGTPGGAHAVEVKSGAALLADGCIVNGLDVYGGAIEAQLYNCRLPSGCRPQTSGHVIAANGWYAGAAARTLSHLDCQRTLFTGSITVEDGAVVAVNGAGGSWCAWRSLAATPLTTAAIVQPSGVLDAAVTLGAGTLWGNLAAPGPIFSIAAGGLVTTDRTAPPNFNAGLTEVTLGCTNIAFAQLPYRNPIDDARWETTNPTNAVEDQFVALAAAMQTQSNVYADLLSLSFTVNGTREVQIWGSWAVVILLGIIGSVILELDGVQLAGTGFGPGAGGAGMYENGAFAGWQVSVAAGAHTVKLRWRLTVAAGAPSAFCRPNTEPDFESAMLLVKELYG